jgi:hypothetical protein
VAEAAADADVTEVAWLAPAVAAVAVLLAPVIVAVDVFVLLAAFVLAAALVDAAPFETADEYLPVLTLP